MATEPPNLEDLLRLAFDARRSARPEDAWPHLLAAEAICRSKGRRRDLVTVLAAMAQLHRDAGALESALRFYEEAVTQCRHLRDLQAFAHTLRHLGEVRLELRHLARAQEHLRDALDIYRSQPATTPLDLANTVRPLAICLEHQGARDQARLLWSEGRDL